MIFLETKILNVKKVSTDANDRIIIMGALIDDEIIILIILYFSSNTELEEIINLFVSSISF